MDRDLLARRSLPGEEEGALFGDLSISDVLTVSGMDTLDKDAGYRFPGTININTAHPLVLMAMLPPGMEDQAQELCDYRIHQEEEGSFANTLDKGWYKQVIDLSANEEKKFDRLIRYSSHLFQAACLVKIHGIERMVTARIIREKDQESGKWKARIIRVVGDNNP